MGLVPVAVEEWAHHAPAECLRVPLVVHQRVSPEILRRDLELVCLVATDTLVPDHFSLFLDVWIALLARVGARDRLVHVSSHAGPQYPDPPLVAAHDCDRALGLLASLVACLLALNVDLRHGGHGADLRRLLRGILATMAAAEEACDIMLTCG